MKTDPKNKKLWYTVNSANPSPLQYVTFLAQIQEEVGGGPRSKILNLGPLGPKILSDFDIYWGNQKIGST